MPSLLDRLGLGGARAVTNAREGMLRHQREEQLVAELLESLAHHEARMKPAAPARSSRRATVRSAA